MLKFLILLAVILIAIAIIVIIIDKFEMAPYHIQFLLPHMVIDQADMVFDIYPMPMAEPLQVAEMVAEQVDKDTDVHNHQIQTDLRKSIAKLQEWYQTIPTEQRTSQSDVYREIKEYIFGDYQDTLDRKERAYSTIRYIQKNDGRLHAVAMSEGEILKLVWQRIKSSENAEHYNDLRNNLVDLLAESAIDIDVPYCLVGRVTRMVQSLQSLDHEEIIDLSSDKKIHGDIFRLMNKYFAQHPDSKLPYDNGDQQAADDLLNYLRSALYEKYPTDMVDQNLEVLK